MHSIHLSIFVPGEPDDVALHGEMIFVYRLHRQARCRTLLDESLSIIEGECECRSGLFAKPISLKRGKFLRRRGPLPLRNKDGDLTVRIDKFRSRRLAVLIESKLQFVAASGELPASHW